MPARVPRTRKPADQLRRRSRPDDWTVLPAAGRGGRAPAWPVGQPSREQLALWRSLWRLPIAAWWSDQGIALTVIARYVALSLERPEHATVGQLERELGLTPASMLRLRLVVEQPVPEPLPLDDPYAHLAGEE